MATRISPFSPVFLVQIAVGLYPKEPPAVHHATNAQAMYFPIACKVGHLS